MVKLPVSGWDGVESFDISDHTAEAIGEEPHFVTYEKDGYWFCEVKSGTKMVASSTWQSEDFPNDLASPDKLRRMFYGLFNCLSPS